MTETYTEFFQLPKDISYTPEEIHEIWEMRPEKPHEIVICGKLIPCPRLQKTQGHSYTFSGNTLDCEAISPMFDRLIEYLNNKLNCNFNMLMINWYRDGNDYIGEHSDDEKQLEPGSPIATVSLGCTRDFVLKNKETKERIIYKLNNNSVLVMGGTCQKTHKHGLPKRKLIQDYRISITLREFK
jgi:alkylated DNA repair dioxygenase AlkB